MQHSHKTTKGDNVEEGNSDIFWVPVIITRMAHTSCNECTHTVEDRFGKYTVFNQMLMMIKVMTMSQTPPN